MNEQKAQAIAEAVETMVRQIIGQEMAKNGVIGKYPETFTKDLIKSQKALVKALTQ